MLRHFFVTAMLQAGVNVKVAQTLAGHHSAAFTLDVYADALPQQMDEAGEKVADVIIAASGSILVANSLANSNSIGSGASSAGLRTLR